MQVLVSKNGNSYHRIDREMEEDVACNTFISHRTEEIDREKAEERGLNPCGYDRCFGDDQ